jgi:hypothetical protein
MRNIRFFNIYALLIISYLFCNSNITAGLNLPQTSAKIIIKGKNHLQLKKYFEPLEDGAPAIDSTIEKFLIQLFPKSFDKGCKDMISAWGKEAKGTASKALRVVYLKNYSKNLQQVFIAYTCYSYASGFGDKFYDERLALLTIDSISSSLTTLPHGEQCNICSDLSRIGMDEELKIGGISAISILFSTSTKNPCCEGKDLKEEVIEKFYILGPTMVKDVLTIVKHRIEKFHKDNSVDSVATYEADCNFDKDPSGSIRQIDVDYSSTLNNSPEQKGVLRYAWNKKLKIFVRSGQ